MIQVSKFSEIEDCMQAMFLSITTVSSAIPASKKTKLKTQEIRIK